MVCRKCGKSATEIGGWLTRVNEIGIKGIWECKPDCEAILPPDIRVIQAIEGKELKAK